MMQYIEEMYQNNDADHDEIPFSFKERVHQEEIDIKCIRIVMQFLWIERKTAATISICIIKVSHKWQQK